MPDKPTKDTKKPVQLPMDETLSVEEALRRTFAAGPMPKKTSKKPPIAKTDKHK